jgi:hypothetical protein
MASSGGQTSKVDNNPLQSALRAVEFWGRATGIYASYKGVQAKGLLMKLSGKDDAYIKETLWDNHHAWAGQQMYELCISLRGFYLKVQSLHVTATRSCSHVALHVLVAHVY